MKISARSSRPCCRVLKVRPSLRHHPSVDSIQRQAANRRSEEHTSELQSRLHLVCRLLLASASSDISTLSLHDALPILNPSVYNPLTWTFSLSSFSIRYAWLNENFRKEFKTVLPCFESAAITATPSQRRFNSTAGGKPEIGRAHV